MTNYPSRASSSYSDWLAAHKLASAKEQAQAGLRHLERRLDGLVYDLYQLTEEEKAHVAGRGAAG